MPLEIIIIQHSHRLCSGVILGCSCRGIDVARVAEFRPGKCQCRFKIQYPKSHNIICAHRFLSIQEQAVLLNPILSKGLFVVAGFRHGRRGPFVLAKGPKTMLAVAWSFECPARFADYGGAQTRSAQTVRAFLRSRLHGSAMPQGHSILMMP